MHKSRWQKLTRYIKQRVSFVWSRIVCAHGFCILHFCYRLDIYDDNAEVILEIVIVKDLRTMLLTFFPPRIGLETDFALVLPFVGSSEF